MEWIKFRIRQSSGKHTYYQARMKCIECGKVRWVRKDRYEYRIRNKTWTGLCHTCNLKLRLGPKHPCWKNGRRKAGEEGKYISIKISPIDKFAGMRNSAGYIQEHRLVMAQKLGRPLSSNEVIHHINGNPMDNSYKNLLLCPSHAIHRAIHNYRSEKKNLKICELLRNQRQQIKKEVSYSL